jgi:hypothetical protein
MLPLCSDKNSRMTLPNTTGFHAEAATGASPRCLPDKNQQKQG